MEAAIAATAVTGGGRTSDSSLWRTAIHESGHVCIDRHFDLAVAGVTLVGGPGYDGLVWRPGSARARGKAAYDAVADRHDGVAVKIADKIGRQIVGRRNAICYEACL
jgi:hypothetical protein